MARPLIDHRGPEFARLTRSILERLGPVFGCAGPIAVYPSSGTGAWEAALVNTLSPGDQVLCCDNGHFARLWGEVARRLGLAVERLGCDWRDPVDPRRLRDCLAADAAGRDPRRPGPAQRDLHGHPERRRRPARGHGRRRPRGPPARRRRLLPGRRRLPPRRVAGGRHRRRLPEGPHAAPGPGVQRHRREGPRRLEEGRPAPLLLGLGAAAGGGGAGVLPLHAGRLPALRARRRPRPAGGGGPARGASPPPPPGRGRPRRRRWLGAGAVQPPRRRPARPP